MGGPANRRVPKERNPMPTMEEVQQKLLETLGDPGISDAEFDRLQFRLEQLRK